MIGRLIIIVTMVLFGPLYIEISLYHPMIVREHDFAAVVPLIASPLGVMGGLLLLTIDNRATAALFAIICAVEIMVGVVGAGIHIALHGPDSLISLVTDPNIWSGEPPPVVPLSFAAAGCLGLIPITMPGLRKLAQPTIAIARILYAFGGLCGLVATIAASMSFAGDVGLLAVITALAFGSFGFGSEIGVTAYAMWRNSHA